ncbi:centrosomal protein of 131 kDa isoform X2 [Gadus morhua]|uniref:centrosomal protein of 131 kDa isoform X2 n=1 Tax=Gadus morhua TaxID=8049 RepID=UPI0011B6D0A8|nr:centrosomal protein of 131 kDa isoform X2 [Gadus morhua]
MMHRSSRSPPSASSLAPGDPLDLSLSGSQLSVSRRPGSAVAAGKAFTRSVSVAADSKGKRNTLSDASLGGPRSIKNLRRSNSTTQVNQQANISLSEEPRDDFLAVFDSSSDGRRKLASLSKASPDRTTWNILDDQPRAPPLAGSVRSAGSVDSQTGRRRDTGRTLAANFTANNRSNKGAVGNSVTTILHNNYSEKPLTPKSSNQRPTFNNLLKATGNDEASLEHGSVTKSQKNFASAAPPGASSRPPPSAASPTGGGAPQGSPAPARRTEVTEQEAERFIQQVNQAVVTIQRWYRHHAARGRRGQAALRRLLAARKERAEQERSPEAQQQQRRRREEERRRVREEKARLARLSAIQELQQKRAQQAADAQASLDQDLEGLRGGGRGGRKQPAQTLLANNSPAPTAQKDRPSPTDLKARPTDSICNAVDDICEVTSFRAASPAPSNRRGSQCSQDILQRSVSVEDQRLAPPSCHAQSSHAQSSHAQSKTTLNDLLDTLKLLEEEPEKLSEPGKGFSRDKYAWIDEDGDSTSLTTDNLERHGQMTHNAALPGGGALLSEAKLQSIMSFLDEMEQSEQERPRSGTSGSHREMGVSEEELAGLEHVSATAAEVTTSVMRLKLDLAEKRRTVNMLQAALAQQRELTVRHVKETEKELNRNFQLQREQYEAAIQRHLAFIDQLIDDKKALGERCEALVAELQQVDQKYTKKISQMEEQHQLEIKKLKELMSATEKVRREKWIDEKTKKIKEITVKGLEPEIQKLISKHKQELQRLRLAHDGELQTSDARAAQRYVRQGEELRQQLERDKDEQCQREKETAKQRYEQQLQEEEMSLQQQRRRLYKEVSEEKERLGQLAARQRAELEDLRRTLEDNSSLACHALREELERSREEQERRHQVEMKSLKERMEIEKQTWEENYMKKEEAWLLGRERELKEEVRRGRDQEIELAIRRLEEEGSGARGESERAAENRVKRVREQYEVELRELEQSERAAVEKQQQLRRLQTETEAELQRLQARLQQRDQEMEDLVQSRDKLSAERRGLAEVIRTEFAERLVATEEENRRMKVEVAEARARLRLEVERVSREKEAELAEVHQRVKSAILKKEETVSSLRKQHEAALKRAEHLEALWEQQRKQLSDK